jgi:aldehyde:ferredoxin oxidoreductase
MGKLVKNLASTRIIFDSLVICTFIQDDISFDLCADLLSFATGVTYRSEDLHKTAVRINTLERLFNVREGITRTNDVLPERLLTEALPDGPAKGSKVKPKELAKMLDEYYEAMGWDVKTGIPLRNNLNDLNL